MWCGPVCAIQFPKKNLRIGTEVYASYFISRKFSFHPLSPLPSYPWFYIEQKSKQKLEYPILLSRQSVWLLLYVAEVKS